MMTCMKNPRYTKCKKPRASCFLINKFIFLRKISCHWQRCKVAAFCNRAEIYSWHRSVTWPVLKIQYFKTRLTRLEWGFSHAQFELSIANGAGAIARKPSGGGTTPSDGERLPLGSTSPESSHIFLHIPPTHMHTHCKGRSTLEICVLKRA